MIDQDDDYYDDEDFNEKKEKSEYDEWREDDYSRRYRDSK